MEFWFSKMKAFNQNNIKEKLKTVELFWLKALYFASESRTIFLV
jgi:hypothetical protein